MKDVYVLHSHDRGIVEIADDFEYLNMQMAKFPADQQRLLAITCYVMHESND